MKLFNLGLLAAVIVVLGLTSDANAQLFRRNRTKVNVVVNGDNGASRVRVQERSFLRSRQDITVSNFGNHSVGFQRVEVRTPAYVNSQLLIQRQNLHQQRFFLNQLNTFTHTPYNNVANIRFINNGQHYYHAAPIVAAPIVQQYVLPSQTIVERKTVVEKQVAPIVQQYVVPPQTIVERKTVVEKQVTQ